MSRTTQEADSSLDHLANYFQSTLVSANKSLEQRQRHSLTQTSLSSLAASLDYLSSCFPPTPVYSTDRPTESIRRPKLSLRTKIDSPSPRIRDQTSPLSNSSSARMERRHSWSDPRSMRRALRMGGEFSSSSSSSEEEEENAKFEQFPPRRTRPSYHRRGRSDPGPPLSSSSANSNKRDLRRSLLKRRATLTHRSNSSSSSSSSSTSLDDLPPPQCSPPRRSRRSPDSPQAMRLKTFNFPSTSSSPFLLAPSANSSYSSSASSEHSRFSDDSSSEGEDESDTSSDEGGEEEKENGNSFDLELDLFPAPPSPSASK